MAKSSLFTRPDLLCKCVLDSEDLVFLNRQMSSVMAAIDFGMRERVTYCMMW